MPQESVTIAIETSSRIGSVALGVRGNLLADITFSEPLRHSSELLPAIQALLDQHGFTARQIRQVFISTGPGSFTGLRIAVATAKAMALANDTRIVPVSTLNAIAANTTASTAGQFSRIATIVDAKRNKFFVAGYKAPKCDTPWAQSPEKILEDCLMTPQEFLDCFGPSDGPVAILGDGLVYYADRFASNHVTVLDQSLWGPKARAVLNLGQKKATQGLFVDAMSLTPHYLRSPQATPKSTL
ncbi:MAG: tRNA (adenosine(37)-N6)-threonylcarbamoyltransferase complex dimerization subunit type 1 TsaB [Phycisphaeraceae bacterium]|nr:tRNA (adenosine(37)-N6)-threonylcarbamoyltransferase complex dimerization subunit type 1 TsaB [Phycisphaeraceae bacterium]